MYTSLLLQVDEAACKCSSRLTYAPTYIEKICLLQVPVYSVYKWQCDPGIRDLTIWQWQHQWKRPWKTDIASLQNFCNFLNFISRLIVWKLSCRWRVRTASKLSRDTVKVIPLPFLFFRELKMWSFDIIAVREWLLNWQKSVMHVPGCYCAY